MINFYIGRLLLLLGGVLTGCTPVESNKSEHSVTVSESNITLATDRVVNFGDANFTHLANKLSSLKYGSGGQSVRIIQLGDSHTAADIFTGKLRSQLQQQFGNAGIGGISPMKVSGQSHALVSYDATGWTLTSSRTEKGLDFPMGGFIAIPSENNASMVIKSYQVTNHDKPLKASLLLKQTMADKPLKLVDSRNKTFWLKTNDLNHWQYINITASLPFTIIATEKNSAELGWLWLEDPQQSGVTLSPLGINGVVQNIWSRWSERWLEDLSASQADLVILAYGTNEGFNENIALEKVRVQLIEGIRTIRTTLPNATILILGVPDSIDKKRLNPVDDEQVVEQQSCEQKQPATLMAIREIQQQVAEQEKTLYWDWMTAMGGPCSIERWRDEELAAADLVHLTRRGYQKSADKFYFALMALKDEMKMN